MIKNGKPSYKVINIDLNGPDGNAFVLLSKAKEWAHSVGMSKEKWQDIFNQCTNGDYENLINILNKHFGHFVIFWK